VVEINRLVPTSLVQRSWPVLSAVCQIRSLVQNAANSNFEPFLNLDSERSISRKGREADLRCTMDEGRLSGTNLPFEKNFEGLVRSRLLPLGLGQKSAIGRHSPHFRMALRRAVMVV
jgi:hypothetical protein